MLLVCEKNENKQKEEGIVVDFLGYQNFIICHDEIALRIT